MSLIQCYVDDITMDRLRRCSAHLGRSVEDLAEAAISEAALRAAPPIPELIVLKPGRLTMKSVAPDAAQS